MPDPVELTRELIRADTNGGREDVLVDLLAPMLVDLGLATSRYRLGPGRSSLIAGSAGSPLTFTGHLDTVPYQRVQLVM